MLGLKAVKIRRLRRTFAARIIRVIADRAIGRRPDRAEFRGQQVIAVFPVARHEEPSVRTGGYIGCVVVVVALPAQTRKDHQSIGYRPFGFGPERKDGGVDGVVIVHAHREPRIARKEAERLKLSFLQPAGCHVRIGADTQGDRIARRNLVL